MSLNSEAAWQIHFFEQEVEINSNFLGIFRTKPAQDVRLPAQPGFRKFGAEVCAVVTKVQMLKLSSILSR